MVRKVESTKAQGFQVIRNKFSEGAIFSKRGNAEGPNSEGGNNLPELVIRDALQDLNKVFPFKSRKKEVPEKEAPIISKKRKIEEVKEVDDDDEEIFCTMEVIKDTKPSEGITLFDIMNAILRPYDRNPYNQTKIYVLGFDKFDYVPAAKSDEQEKRSKNINFKKLEPIDFTDFNKPIYNFNDYLQDRDGWRRKIIKFVCMTLLRPGTNLTLRTQDRKVFILDGHCLTLSELNELMNPGKKKVGIEIDLIEKVKTDKQAYMCPISIYFSNGERKIQMEVELANNIGECDFLPFFYISYVTKGFKDLKFQNFEIISIDTDSVYLSLIYFHNILLCLNEDLPSFDLSTSPGVPVPDKKSKIKLPQIIIQKIARGKTEWININNLYKNINDQGYNIIELMILLVSCGSDFTDSHYGITYKTFFEAYDQFRDHIGPLFRYKYNDLNYKEKLNEKFNENPKNIKYKDKLELIERYHKDKDRQFYSKKDYYHLAWILPNDFLISAGAYMRLLKCAYGKAYPNRFDSYTIEAISTLDINKYLTGEEGTGKKSLDKKKLMPPQDDLKDSLYQVYYYVRMMFSVGLPTVKDSRPLDYGYRLKDETRGIKRGNITKKRFILPL